MPEASILNCPSCGAPLDPPAAGTTTVRCPYCKHAVMIPGQSADSSKKAGGAGRQEIIVDLRGGQKAGTARPEDLAELQRLVAERNEIGAIALYRRLYNSSLADAKNAVDQMVAGGMPPIYPSASDSLAAKKSGPKVLAILLVVFILIAALAAFVAPGIIGAIVMFVAKPGSIGAILK